MTQKEKIKAEFIKSPRTLPFRKIRTFLEGEWSIEIDAGGSHFKIQGEDGRAYIVPLHHGDCAGIYKKHLLQFYLSYQS